MFDRSYRWLLPDLTASIVVQLAEARQLHADNLEAFKKARNLIECTIIQQINTAIDEDCLTDLINKNTELLEGMVPQILKEFFDT